MKPLDSASPLFVHNLRKLLSISLTVKFLETSDLFFHDRKLEEKEVLLILEDALSEFLDSVREKINLDEKK